MKFLSRQTPLILAIFLVVLILSADAVPALAGAPLDLQLIEVKKVWDEAPHNAFTDLVRFDDKWFLAFREGPGHVVSPPSGNVRVLSSDDGKTWESAALLQANNADLRDPKLSITPEGKLMLTSGKRAVDQQGKVFMQTLAFTSDDGVTWGNPSEIGEHNWWMWGTTWGPDGNAYGVGYDCGAMFSGHPAITRLYRSEDGINYDTILPSFVPSPLETNETSLLFRKDGSCVAFVRSNGSNALVGTANADYTDWTFRDLGEYIGGPEIIETPAGNILAAGRFYEDGVARTAVGLLDPEAGQLNKLLTLPSGGDCSYPGMAIHNGQLLLSYYSTHEGKSSIYLARMNLIGETIPEPSTIALLLSGLAGLILWRRR